MCYSCGDPEHGVGSIVTRVKRSAAMLDRVALLPDSMIPADWRDRIDADRLDMFDGNRCIVGQLCNGYYITGVDWLQSHSGDEDASFAYRHAFVGNSYNEDRQIAEVWRQYLADCKVIPPAPVTA